MSQQHLGVQGGSFAGARQALLELVAHEGYALLEHRSVPFGIHQLRSSLRRPVALALQLDPLAAERWLIPPVVLPELNSVH